MCDNRCNGLLILSDDHLRYDTNGDFLLESEEIAQIPPNEQTLDLFTDPSRFIWQDESDVVCTFISLDLLSQLRFARNDNFERFSSFADILRSSRQEKALAFADFMRANTALFSERSLVDTLLRSAELTFARGPDEQGLLEPVLEDLPQILAVGEAHSLPSDSVTTAQLFADRLLPLLKNGYGYDTLVLESLPWDLPSAELDYFMECGVVDEVHTPSLSTSVRLLQGGSANDLKYILRRCGELGISVRGGSPSLDDIMLRNGPNFGYEIRDRSEEVIREALRTEEKVMWYGGLNHNDVDGGNPFSFAPTLSQRYSFVELDLIGPYNGDAGLYNYLGYYIIQEDLPICPNEDDLLLMTVNQDAYVVVYPPDIQATI